LTAGLNLVIPIPTLLFAAADKAFKKSGLLIAMALVQSVFLLLWVIFQLVHMDILLLYWQLIMDENTTLRVEGRFLFENYYSVLGRMLAENEYDEMKSYFNSMLIFQHPVDTPRLCAKHPCIFYRSSLCSRVQIFLLNSKYGMMC
jgi:hypothetical protein